MAAIKWGQVAYEFLDSSSSLLVESKAGYARMSLQIAYKSMSQYPRLRLNSKNRSECIPLVWDASIQYLKACQMGRYE
jgi:hypothetical protein